MNEALGRASRMCRAKPSMKSYWLRCASSAMTTMLRRSDSTGWRSPFSSGKNFWIVVNTTPPEATLSFSRRSARSAAWTGVLAQQIAATGEGAEKLVVEIVAVGEDDDGRVLHRRVQDHAAGVEGHRQALAGALRVPDDADAPVAEVAARLAPRLVLPKRLYGLVGLGGAQRFLHRHVHGVELVIARHLLGEFARRRHPRTR